MAATQIIGPFGWSFYFQPGSGPTAQTFRQALFAKLNSISELTAIVGTAIYPGVIPQTRDYQRDGPALAVQVPTNPRGHVLSGSDGTSTARVQISACGYLLSQTDAITQALFNALDGLINDDSWGDGTVTIVTCLQDDEADLAENVEVGQDLVNHQIDNFYSIKYRVSIPTNT